jgi:hypothetical protein
VQPPEWRYDAGGFGVAYPAPWESASEDDVVAAWSFGTPVPGSAYRRATGGLFLPRFITARTYSLGAIASTREVALSLIDGVERPVESLTRVATVGRGGRLAAYRYEDDGEPMTQAAVVFRGRGASGYLIGLTGRREDEAILLAEARQIADSIRYDGVPPREVIINNHATELLDVSLEVLGAVRPPTRDEFGPPRDSSGWSITPVTRSDLATVEQCRAGAMWLLEGAPVRSPLLGIETQLTCATSRIVIRRDIRSYRWPPTLRQVDDDGRLVYEVTFERSLTPREPIYWVVNGERIRLRMEPVTVVRIGS